MKQNKNNRFIMLTINNNIYADNNISMCDGSKL